MAQMSEKFDIVMRQLMLAKLEMGSAVIRDSSNPFHKTKYASLGAHLDHCEITLSKHGLILLQTINGTHEKPILISNLCHLESGQWIKSYTPLINPKNDSQGLGGSITYMRRYSMACMLGLSSEDDDAESACVRPTDLIHPAQVKELKELESKVGEECRVKSKKFMIEKIGADEYTKLTQEQYRVVKYGFEANLIKKNKVEEINDANSAA